MAPRPPRPLERRERAPWWRRSLGLWGIVCASLVLVSLAIGVLAERTSGWLGLQGILLGAAAVTYMIGLVRSPD